MDGQTDKDYKQPTSNPLSNSIWHMCVAKKQGYSEKQHFTGSSVRHNCSTRIHPKIKFCRSDAKRDENSYQS